MRASFGVGPFRIYSSRKRHNPDNVMWFFVILGVLALIGTIIGH